MIRHIVMWNVAGASHDTRRANIERLVQAFEGLRGVVPGLLKIEVGVDESGVDYACDVVLYTEFDSSESLRAYASHPEHARVRLELGDVRTARHQVDYTVRAD